MTTTADGYPLSFAQEQMWFLDQLRSGATEHLMHWAYRLRGSLDTGALTAALTEVARRHEILRTRYRSVEGTPVQVIDGPAPAPLSVVDISAEPDPDRRLDALSAAEVSTPIDLSVQWPWRVVLVTLRPDESVLMVTVHHIAFDGWSVGVLAEELGALYAAYGDGRPSPLAEPPVQYADFAEWQRDWWDSPDRRLPAQRDHWRERLAGLAPLELPTDRPRAAHWVADGDVVAFAVPAEVASALAAVGRSRGATPFMVHLAAFQLLLSRYAGTEDVAVGVSLAGRNQVELEQLVGMFLNTVVLRTDLTGDPSFGELVTRVRRTTLDAYDHQDVPFERVVADLAPERDLSRNPVFQVGFAMHNAHRVPLSLPGLEVTKEARSRTNSEFDLSLHLVEGADGSLAGSLYYPTALFDRSRVERFAADLGRLLVEAAAAPDRPVGALEIVGGDERRRLLGRRTAPARPAGSLPELFAGRARATPDAVAVVTGSGPTRAELTYAELAARVDRLADHLAARGVGPETPVGIAMERGADLVTALLAVLTAGGVHVPLPPDHPTDRTAYVLADAGVELVLTQESARGTLPAGVTAVAVDTEWAAVAASVPTARPVLAGGAAAYVIHTSGSTGRPKGVVVTHEGIRNRVLWAVERHGLTAADRVLQKTTIGFDASVWEFLAPLVSGGSVVMAPPTAHRDPAVMVAAVAEHGVTVLQLVPSVLRMVVEEPGLAACTSLRVVCSAGEPLPVSLCEQLWDVLDVELVNTYGPTECSIDATAWTCARTGTAGIAPIGGPLPGVGLHVVDAADRLVPIGVPGELCVSGVGLARGYAGRGDLTAERFTPNPYAPVPGERWYRTGDLVRWRETGELEFVGRVDAQLKVRGVRVEPGEVEAALRTHPAVAAAAVTGHRSAAGDLELVAYTVADGTPAPVEALREHLAERLPAALVPSTFLALDALPLTATGKLDRRALPAPDAVPATPAAGTLPPRTDTERRVAEVMAEVLGVPEVGATDDFFALGGHSLLAIRLVMRLRRAFDLELTVGQLFGARSVEQLAALVEEATAPATGAIVPVSRADGLPLSFGQQRLWFLDRLEPDSAEYLIPLAIRLRGPFEPGAFRQALADVAGTHEVLRTRYVGDADPVQVIDPPGPVAVDVVDLTGRADAAALARARVDAACDTPFDLSREHPLRVTVARADAEDHWIAITLHHIAFDAWSMGIFLRDLDTAYRAAVAGRPSPLRPPAVQYADFAAWQRGQDLSGQLEHWRTALAGLTAVELPADRPRPAVRDPRGDTVQVDVPQEVALAVAELGRRHGATPFMTLLAAFQVLLARYTGRTDIAVGTPVAGRTRQETEDVLGFFVNNLVVRTNVAADPTFAHLLDQVRRVTLDAFANQDVPFEHLVDALRPDRDLSRNPLFQVMFELAHLDEVPATLGGAALEPVNAGTPVAKFDLTLSVKQLAGGRLRCWFEYATALFDRSTVERMAAHYLRLLASVVGDPGRRLAELELRPDAERATLRAWADPEPELAAAVDPAAGHHLGVAELVARQAARTPDALAVVFDDQRATYAQLDADANRLAHHLRSLGVGPEVLVGCCLQRGLDAVVVLLAVLRSGGVYTPFDPAHPAERLAFMLTDAGVRVVVTTGQFADRLAGDGHRTVAVDRDRALVARCPATAPPVLTGPDNLAYVIYTSGSTGRPKGVMIEHRSYAHHSHLMGERFGIRPSDRAALLSALTFDAAMEQVASTLVAGATLVVADPVFWTPEDLPARVAEHGVTLMELTPAYYREIMKSDVAGLASLRLVNVGSDVVTVADVQRWAAAGLPGRFVCNYGPTEATITSVLHPVVEDDLAGSRSAAMPIGRPIPGTRAVVLDARLRPVPLGVPGELCLGGVRLARGYLGRPELTADRFVPDPDGAEPGARLYRTGDLVRHRPDGTIDFLGRIDQQVKIRGFRIELGEIEAALVRHPDVREAVVVAREVAPGDRQLVAYLVCPGATPDVGGLRAHLRDLLPEYMIPSLWTTLAALPMTTSKKVDRTALPDPVRVGAGREHQPPRDPVEEAVAAIWTQVLDVEQVGVDDNFFALGGHSLLATRVLAGLRTAFGVDLPLRLLFEATTVAELAAAVTGAVEADIAALSDADVEALLAQEGVR